MLSNRSFVGELWHRDRWNTGAHAPVVDLELSEQAQVIADDRTDNATAARRAEASSS